MGRRKILLCSQEKERPPLDKDRSLISRAEGARALLCGRSSWFGPADSGCRALMRLFKQRPVIAHLYWWLLWGTEVRHLSP